MRLTTERLVELLTEHGWEITDGGSGRHRALSPFQHWNRRTPDHARLPFHATCGIAPALWPQETYTSFHQVVWSMYQGRRIHLGVRDAPAPWTPVVSAIYTHARLVAYIAELGRAACEAAMAAEAERVR